MKKKLFPLVILAALFSLNSCGTTKAAEDVDQLLQAPVEQAEEALELLEQNKDELEAAQILLDEAAANRIESAEQAETAAQEEQDLNNADDQSQDDYLKEYPEPTEIEEPDIIDIPIEEIIAREQQKEKERAEQAELEAAIVEPVAEEDVTPPSEVNAGVPESVEGAEGVEETEQQENADLIEPTIEIQEEPEEIVIVPSRSVTLKKGETLVIRQHP